MKQVFRLTGLAAAAFLFTLSAALAEGYRLLPGDRITLSYTTQGTTAEMMVDIDGQLRLPGAGAVPVAGVTLDEAEALIDTAIKEAGVFLNSSVSLLMLEYAPVLISGDVGAPGKYPYFPGMTVGAALALSGGSQLSGVSRFEIERARIENEGALRSINLSLAGSVLRISRLEALVNDAEVYSVSDVLVRRVPQSGAVAFDALKKAEEQLFETSRTLAVESLDAWSDEISLIEDQLALFEQRISVQDGIIENTAEELDRAKGLQERGLQTATRLTSVIQRDADARARALELESARITAVQALAEAQRLRANFIRNRREDWLTALQAARLTLERDELDYARRLEQQAMLTGDLVSSLMLSEVVEPSFVLFSPREGRNDMTRVDLGTTILPGEMLTVTMGLSTEAAAPAN